MPTEGFDLVETCDGAFKSALDRYKYASRYENADPETERARAGDFIIRLNDSLSGQAWLFGPGPTVADLAILPFVRQFAHVDLDWFAAQPWDDVQHWLDAFKASGRFRSIMTKYPPWPPGHVFPAPGPG